MIQENENISSEFILNEVNGTNFTQEHGNKNPYNKFNELLKIEEKNMDKNNKDIFYQIDEQKTTEISTQNNILKDPLNGMSTDLFLKIKNTVNGLKTNY